MLGNTIRYEVIRMVNITTSDPNEAEFFEVHEIHMIDGTEKRHRNIDRSFATFSEAENWIDENSQ